MRCLKSDIEGVSNEIGHLSERARKFVLLHGITLDWMTYFITEQGRVGRGRRKERVGDILAILDTGRDPFILRYEGDSNVATLIGDAYLDGCMYPDSIPSDRRGPDEWFNIG